MTAGRAAGAVAGTARCRAFAMKSLASLPGPDPTAAVASEKRPTPRPRRHDASDFPAVEPPRLEIQSTPVPLADPEDMLAATDPAAAELARQVTSRPPVKPPIKPPMKARVPIRPRVPGADDALLTPQELAAAFQLDFSPADQRRRRASRLGIIAIVVLLLAGGVAVLMYLRPDLREQASGWCGRTYESIKGFISSRTSPAAPPSRLRTPGVTLTPTRFLCPNDATEAAAAGDRAARASAAASQERRGRRGDAQVDGDPGRAESGTVVIPAPSPAPVTTKMSPPPAPQPAPPPAAAPTPATKPAAQTGKTMDPAQAYAEVKRLWAKAIDARGTRTSSRPFRATSRSRTPRPAPVRPGPAPARRAQAREVVRGMHSANLQDDIGAVPAGSWVVAVSGGADSVALLELLRHRADLALHVAHLDHETRAGESAADAEFVRQLATQWGLPCTIARRGEIEAAVASVPRNTSARYRAARLALFRDVVARHKLQV